jgi:hypothetical protein
MTETKTVYLRLILTLALFATAVTCNAQTTQKQQAALRDAPVLKLDKLLQAPPEASADWSKLKGKMNLWMILLRGLSQEFQPQPASPGAPAIPANRGSTLPPE